MAICVKFRSLANTAYALWNSYRLPEIASDLLRVQYRRHDIKIAAAVRTTRDIDGKDAF